MNKSIREENYSNDETNKLNSVKASNKKEMGQSVWVLKLKSWTEAGRRLWSKSVGFLTSTPRVKVHHMLCSPVIT